jgi:hypothetical protein
MVRLFVIACVSLIALAACQSARNIVAPQAPNPGPCPNALSLYDAHRLVQINGDAILYENVGFTGEILRVESSCLYSDRDGTPISSTVEIIMAFGRGPAAVGQTHTYELFLTVTGFNDVIIDKLVYPVTVTFEPGEDRVSVIERFDPVVIPRASGSTSGTNFEILVGFELDEEQIDFNRRGLRFRVNAGQD